MKGDFTRRTFRDDKHFTRVLMQQGRVQLDADWNEQLEIDAHAAGTTHTDVIGGCGVPKDGGGFAIGVTADGHDLTIAPGRIYVDGILCEFGSEPVDVTALTADRAGLVHLAPGRRRLRTGDHLELSGGDASVIVRVTGVDADARRVGFEPSLDTATRGALGPRVRARRTATYATQPDLPSPPHVTVPDEGPPAVALDDGTYLVYLDVWERHVTTVEDPELLEPALGGPDTTTRVQNVAQIRLARLAGGASTCADVPGFDALAAADAIAKPSTGRLAARATPEVTTGDCTMPEAAGFRGLENQLYRVEVHTPGPLGTATFKWSRDNGTVVTRWLGQHGHDLEVADTGRDEVLSFAAGQTVELTDASRVMAGEPGLLTTVHAPPRGDVLPVDPADAVSFADFASDPIVRRWDSDGDEPTADGWIALEHGVEVRFTDGWYNTGDFWLIPARTATGTVDWPRDDDDPPLERSPEGIVHGRCRLAVVRSASGSLTPLDDCRERFPSLTAITAADVDFDNAVCTIPGADTVQDALDHLCRERDLRHHNKHLHGWGVVCGLRVTCGPDEQGPRRHVTVSDGYAIDCDGNDVILEQAQRLDVLELIKRDRRALLRDGDGDVCLTLSPSGFGLEPFKPNRDDLASLLSDTLLMDVYRECVRPVERFLGREFRNDDRRSVAINLLAQLQDPVAGQRVFISRSEHEILRRFYERLRELLRSQTYCAMFEDARPFPSYPQGLPPIRTIVNPGNHFRLRVRPNSTEGYSIGAGLDPRGPKTIINRIDLDEGVVRERIDPIAGATSGDTDAGVGEVRDVAFSPDGRRIYAIAAATRQEDTFFRAGRIRDEGIAWGPLQTICGVRLRTLATTPADAGSVYAVGDGKGLFRIDPEDVEKEPEPLVAFDAAGHMRITDGGRAVVTERTQKAPAGSYDALQMIDVRRGSTAARIELDEPGSDDIAVHQRSAGARRETAYAVIGEREKRIVAFDLQGRAVANERGEAAIPVDGASLRLEVAPETNTLLVSAEDRHDVRLVDLTSNELTDRSLPAQVGPIAMASDGKHVYTLNGISSTVSKLPADLLTPGFRFPQATLAAYRKAVLEAFADLTGGFLQYLKDCVCDHLLPECPTCTDDDVLTLACVSVRGGQVQRVCNHGARKTVLSFPTVGYWLSAVPVLPLLDAAIDRICCAVLPERFGNLSPANRTGALGSVTQLRLLTQRLQSAEVGGWLQELLGRLRAMAGSFIGSAAREGRGPTPVSRVVDQPVERAVEDLEARGVEVRRVPVEAGAPSVATLVGMLRNPAPGDAVTLVEHEGRVAGYTVAPATATMEARLAELEAEVSRLRRSRTTSRKKKTTTRKKTTSRKER